MGLHHNATYKYAKTYVPIQVNGYMPRRTIIWSVSFIDGKGNVIQKSSMKDIDNTKSVAQLVSLKQMLIPNKNPWYVQIEGQINGHDFVRLSKSAIIPKVPKPPTIEVEQETFMVYGIDKPIKANVTSDLPYTLTLVPPSTSALKIENRQVLDSKTNEFLVEKPEKSLEGAYKITVTSEAGFSSDITFLRVGERPPVAVIEKAIYIGHVGSDFKVSCKVDSSLPTKVLWFHNDLEISIGEYLQIDQLKWNNGGVYRCEATSTSGTGTDTTELKIVQPPKVKIRPVRNNDKTGKDKIVDDLPVNSSVILKENDRLNAHCQFVMGYPRPRVQWYKNGTPLNRISLNITANEFSEGRYSCKAKNDGGQYEEYLDVKYAQEPRAVLSGENEILVEEWNNFVATCKGTGYPAPVIRWVYRVVSQN